MTANAAPSKNFCVKGIAVIVASAVSQRDLLTIAEDYGRTNIYPSYNPGCTALACFNFVSPEKAASFAAAVERVEGLCTLEKSPLALALGAGVSGAVSAKQAVFAHQCLRFGLTQLEAAFSEQLGKQDARLNELVANGTFKTRAEAEQAMKNALAKRYGLDGSLDAAALIEKYKSLLPRP